MRYLFLLLLLFFLCTSGRAQNIIITGSIGLTDDQCSPVINDPNTDCINVPAGTDMLTYLPGEDGDIIVTYRLTNNSGGTITRALIEDSERGVIVPVTTVNIPPGNTVVTNRVYPAETMPATTVATVTATLESAGGSSIVVEGDYTLEVVAPSVTLGAELYAAEEECTDPSDLSSCGTASGGTPTLELPAGDIVYLEMPLTNTGLTTLTNHSWTISEGIGEVVSTSANLNAANSIIARYLLDPPDAPGNYNYTITYTGEDLAGNSVSTTEDITVTVAAPMAATSMELYVARDLCDDEGNLSSCGIGSGGTNSLTLPPGRFVYLEVNIENTGVDSLTNHAANVPGLGVFGGTSFRLRPGGTITMRNVMQAPVLPGTYSYTVTYSSTDIAGTPLEIDMPITLTVPGPQAATSMELYVARDICDDEDNLTSCGIGSGGGNTLTIPPGRYFYAELNVENTHIDTLINHGGDIPGIGEFGGTGFRLRPDGSITMRNVFQAPLTPGNYNYTVTYTSEDQFGNPVANDMPIILTVPGPQAATSMELYVARDICDDEDNLTSCGIGSGGGNTLTIPPGRYFYAELNVENTHIDTLINHGGDIPGIGEFGGTGFRLRPDGSITMRNVFQAPLTPGNYNYTVTYTSEDQFGNPVANDMPIILTVPGPQAATSMELYVARDICDDEDNLTSCGIGAGGGNTLTIPPGRYFYAELNVENTHIDTLINHGGDIPGIGEFGGTGFRLRPDGSITMRNVFQAPLTPGNYNYTVTYTSEDQFGNPVANDMPITLTVPAPQAIASVELYRAADVCTEPDNLSTCGVTSGGGDGINVGVGEWIYIQFPVENTGIDTLINHVTAIPGLGDVGVTSFRLRPSGSLIFRGVLQAPNEEGTFNYDAEYSAMDQFGNPVLIEIPITVKTRCSDGDFGPPVALCRNRTITLTEGEVRTINAGQIDNGSFDACGNLAGGAIDVNTFTCAEEGPNTVTLTVGDQSGNSATCTATVTVVVEDLIQQGVANNCLSETHPVMGGQAINDLTINGQLVAQVIISGNSIDEVRVEVFKSGNMTERVGNADYLSKRIALTMLENGSEVQPDTDPVIVRLYYSQEEIAALEAASTGSSEQSFTIIKTSDDDCGDGFTGADNTGMSTSISPAGCGGTDRYFEFFTGTFSTFYLFASDVVLPVELGPFTATALPKTRVQLTWRTLTESGNSHFDIERSTDGRSFTFLGAVAGAGDSAEEQGYDFIDEAAVPGLNYYRLRQVDFDGTETLSEVRQVMVEGENQLKVFPNPVTNELRLAGFAGGPIRVLDGQGRVLFQQNLRETERLSVAHLQPGFYLLQTPTETVRWIKK